ncbi:unnamed protein product [Brachionus calyciflorus]|uniref:Uncharacterized protein n=1 Tax=Brachionus calyciflorus TaxID=104777 RepID=A0A813M3A8_9BILA|nr:unnamed protein product [Brachionus calyciflorus]
MNSIRNLFLFTIFLIVILIITTQSVETKPSNLVDLLEEKKVLNNKLKHISLNDFYSNNHDQYFRLLKLKEMIRLKRSNHLELCKNVNCSNIHSNGQVSKTWRMAQLAACCPSYRKQYSHHLKKNSI